MIPTSGRRTASLACALLASACATTYDRDLADARRDALFGGASAATSAAAETLDDGTDGGSRDGIGEAGGEPGAAPARAALDPALLATPDLARYTALALERSAALRAAYAEWRAALEGVELGSTLPDPRLTWTEFLEEVQTRTGPQERRLGLSQAFPWPGELDARARVAGRRAEAAWQRVEAARLGVLRDVAVAYQAYALLGRELSIADEQLALLRGLEPAVLSRVRTGGGQQDLLRLQVEIGRLEDERARLARRRPVLAARLADAMTLPVQAGSAEALLPVPALAEPAPPELDVAAALARAGERNPGLAALAEELAARQEAVAVARFRGKPSLGLGVDWIVTGAAVAPGVRGSGDDPVAVGLSVSLPVWRGSVAAAEREARHRARAARERLTAAGTALAADVETEAWSMEDAARRIALYRDSLLPRADEALALTLSAYRTGGASLTDLIDAERVLLEFDRAFWRACSELQQSAARLRALTGADVLGIGPERPRENGTETEDGR